MSERRNSILAASGTVGACLAVIWADWTEVKTLLTALGSLTIPTILAIVLILPAIVFLVSVLRGNED